MRPSESCLAGRGMMLPSGLTPGAKFQGKTIVLGVFLLNLVRPCFGKSLGKSRLPCV